MWRDFVKEYLCFSRKERFGILILLFFIVTGIAFPFFFRYILPRPKNNDPDFEKEISSLVVSRTDSLPVKEYSTYRHLTNNRNEFERFPAANNENHPVPENFYFDPNNTSATDWKRLGVRDKTIQTIQKYLSRGGHFYQPSEISKIWGLQPNDIQRLTRYVRLGQTGNTTPATHFENKQYAKTVYAHGLSQVIPDINTADTGAFIALPGIGSKLAQRIIKFREKLGGFTSVSQVAETFGLPDSTFQKIKPWLQLSQPVVKQLNINSATLDELKNHPYIRYPIANAIVTYRQQHGPFSSVADIKKIMLVSPESYQKLLPYITIGL